MLIRVKAQFRLFLARPGSFSRRRRFVSMASAPSDCLRLLTPGILNLQPGSRVSETSSRIFSIPIRRISGPDIKEMSPTRAEKIRQIGNVRVQLFAASAPFVVVSAVITATFRSLSDTRTPMVITMGAVALNTLLGFFLELGIPLFQNCKYSALEWVSFLHKRFGASHS